LKALIATRCSLTVDKQRLIFKGKVLVNDKPLSEYSTSWWLFCHETIANNVTFTNKNFLKFFLF